MLWSGRAIFVSMVVLTQSPQTPLGLPGTIKEERFFCCWWFCCCYVVVVFHILFDYFFLTFIISCIICHTSTLIMSLYFLCSQWSETTVNHSGMGALHSKYFPATHWISSVVSHKSDSLQILNLSTLRLLSITNSGVCLKNSNLCEKL